MNTAKTDAIARRLEYFNILHAPAFSDGDSEFTVQLPNKSARKYTFLPSHGLDMKSYQGLSEKGFENCLRNWLTRDGNWYKSVQYNAAAEEVRKAIIERENAERVQVTLREEAAREQELQQRLQHATQMALTAEIEKSSKWQVHAFELTEIGTGGKRSKRSVKGWVSCGIGIHSEMHGKWKKYKLTHIESGLGFGLKFDSLSAAKTAATRIVHCVQGRLFQALTLNEIGKSSIHDLVAAMAENMDANVYFDKSIQIDTGKHIV